MNRGMWSRLWAKPYLGGLGVLAGVLLVGLCLVGQPLGGVDRELQAQEPSADATPAAAPTADEARAHGAGGDEAGGDEAPGDHAGSGEAAGVQPPPKIEPDKSTPTLLQRATEGVNTTLGSWVSFLDGWLFWRPFGQRQYVQFADKYYAREAGSEGDFVEVRPPAAGEGQRWSLDRVKLLAAEGKLRTDGDGNPISRGTLTLSDPPGVKPLGVPRRLSVEYVTAVGGAKYILEGDQYLKVLGRLEKLDRDAPLSDAEVLAAARRGELVLDDEKVRVRDPRPYLHVEQQGPPLVVLWLTFGAIFCTVYMRGYNLWGFWHAIQVVRGKYDDPDEPGEVTHFQALASALSATVGLGNIAGVTIAMSMGGPGAFFWMMFCGVFGMSSKFVECTLGQKYRLVKKDGTVQGGPMQYLREGLKSLGLGPLGSVMAFLFTVMCIMASLGGGNMFQANQSGNQMLVMLQRGGQEQVDALGEQIKSVARDEQLPEAEKLAQIATLQQQRQERQQQLAAMASWFKPVYGLVLMALVGVVIVGGIKRIGAAASKVVPSMCFVYLAACLFIILRHVGEVPAMVGSIFSEAFSPEAFGGGVLGVLVIGVQRAAFSNEAGVGSASIAHSAAKTDEPIREGTVALMEPFIDTVVVCSMTALVILITGAWDNSQWIVDEGLTGAALTSRAFGSEISFFPYILSLAVVLFAYSTLISWSYYGERCWEQLFGPRSTIVYKGIFLVAVYVGSVVSLDTVINFSDMMLFSMAFPNILGLILLSPQVRRDLVDYWRRYRSGEFDKG